MLAYKHCSLIGLYYFFSNTLQTQFRNISEVALRRTMEQHQVVKDVIDTVPLHVAEVCFLDTYTYLNLIKLYSLG